MTCLKMLLNHLVCRNKLLKYNAFTVKNDCQYPVGVSPDFFFFNIFLNFILCAKDGHFHIKGCCFFAGS